MAATAAPPGAEDAGSTSAEDASQWPMGKFRANLESWLAAHGRPANGFAVVVTTGAMNPIHLGHVQLLHQAKERLDAEGFGVVGAWVSPSNDEYVQPKCRALNTIGLNAGFRLEIARRAVSDDGLVACGSWEAEYEGRWPDFPEVTEALQEELSGQPEAEHLVGPKGFPQVFYACGTDHASKCGLYHGMDPNKDIGIVVVPRSGERPSPARSDRRVYVAEPASGPVAAFSSTKVRASVASGDFGAVSDAMSAKAAAFLLQPAKEEYDFHEANGSNYTKLNVPSPS